MRIHLKVGLQVASVNLIKHAMGSGASTSVSSLLTHADSTEVESVFASLPPACREKLEAALASHEVHGGD